MKDNAVYTYQPTGRGIRYESAEPSDPERSTPCVLYPDNRRELLFDPEELKKREKIPFRPFVLAKLSPRYEIHFDNVGGMGGFGRLAFVKGAVPVFLDEFQHVTAEYENGEVRYTAQDDRISPDPVYVTFVSGRGACGLLIQVDTTNSRLDTDTKLYWLHGGVLGWQTHSPYRLEFSRDMVRGNVVSLSGSHASIRVVEEVEDAPNPFGLKRFTSNDGWFAKDVPILFRADEDEYFAAPPDALRFFRPGQMVSDSGREVPDAIVCAGLPTGSVCYAAVGIGNAIREAPLDALFSAMRESNRAIAERLTVKTGDPAFDGAVAAGAFPTDGVFGDNVFLHGNLSWREGYQGWRVAYGPLAYGMFREAAEHFRNHFTFTRITEGPDRGGFNGTIEGARPDGIMSYNMHQTFLHQARRYWEYTGDNAFAAELLPILEEAIERDLRRLRPGKELLLESCLNTWISDHHWTIMGQCTQGSAYLYNLMTLAAELSEDPKRKAYWTEQAETVKQDLNRVLWQKRKGVFAYARDLKGNGLIHDEPELADIYHPTELGVADPIRTYQMLDWAKDNLDWVRTDNGGKMCRSSNWHPNGGDLYSHSIYELNGGEELNLALAYQQIGLAGPAYEIFKFVYMSLYGGRDPGVPNFDYDTGRVRGGPHLYTHTALNLPCHLSVNGTGRMNPLFGDTIGMFGREVFEGILGIHPQLQRGEILLAPCLPEEMPEIEVHSALIDYEYKRSDTELRLKYDLKKSGTALRTSLLLPVSEVTRVTLGGREVPYSVEPGFCSVSVSVDCPDVSSGEIVVEYRNLNLSPIDPRREVSPGEALDLGWAGETVLSLEDPQGLLSDVRLEKDRIAAKVTESEGSGVFFLRMKAGGAAYIRPVKLRIGKKKAPAVFRSFREEFAAPYAWKPVDMDALFNYDSPKNAADGIISTAERPPEEYSQFNFGYYTWHVIGDFTRGHPLYGQTPDRWRSLVNDDGIAVTGEGIPFRSKREGNCMAAATLVSPSHPDRITVPVGEGGRAVYLLITGITLPMQSHVENLRITVRYEDGTEEEHRLFNPDGIGDMWFTKFGRWHDTPANGFENIGGGRGALSSAGLDLSKPVETDLEAHILRFRLREGVPVSEIEMRIIANDVIFALMGVTVLK